tara:strand:- start:926 stop:1126 length:201 start_codon:yes stop_codon:yes gene_type:complete
MYGEVIYVVTTSAEGFVTSRRAFMHEWFAKRVQQGNLTIFREHNPKVIIRKYSWKTLPKSINEVTI